MKKTITVMVASLLLAAACFPAPWGAHAQDDTFTIFFTEDFAFSTVLPDGWAASGSRENGLTVASSPEGLEVALQEKSHPRPGDLFIKVIALADSEMEGRSMAEFLPLVAQYSASQSESPVTLGEVVELDLAGRAGVAIRGTSKNTGAYFFMYPLAPGYHAVGTFATVPDELDANTDQALNVIATVRCSLPLEETQDDPAVTFNYPAGWVLNVVPPLYMVASSQEAAAAEDLSSGQFKILMADLADFGVDVAALTVAEATTTWVNMLLEEGETAGAPLTITLGDIEVITIDVKNKDGAYIGGVFVLKFPTLENVVRGVAFATAPGENYQVSLTALNMLLGLKVAAPQ